MQSKTYSSTTWVFPVGKQPHKHRSARFQFIGALIAMAALMLAINASAANILNVAGFEAAPAAQYFPGPTIPGWVLFGAGWGNIYTGSTFADNNSYTPVQTKQIKCFGQFTGGDNYTGMFQDNPASVGNTYTADGWILSQTSDGGGIHGSDAVWYEVSFRDSGTNVLALYRSAILTSANLALDIWTHLPVVNQYDPSTFTITNTVTSLVSPPGTAFVRYQLIFFQGPDQPNGSALFTDFNLNQTAGPQPPTIGNISPSGSALFNNTNKFSFTVTSPQASLLANGYGLVLNGLDVSSQLQISGDSSSQTVNYTGLVADRLYTATITVTDAIPFVVTRTVTFDTFNPANFVAEAEDYDYNYQYFNNPTPTSVAATNSYFERPGVADVDWHESGNWQGNNAQAYREIGAGPGVEWTADIVRQKYLDAIAGGDADVHDYDVGWVSGLGGDWMNYTRDIPAGSYNVYGRLAGGGGVNKCQLAVVTSGAGTTTQTINVLGTMTMNGTGYQSWNWVPLTDTGGNLIKLDYATARKVTFRVSADGLNMNFFMLTPARTDLPLIANLYPTGTKPFEPANTLSFNASSAVATIPTGNVHVALNGNNVDSLLAIGSNPANRTVSLPVLASNATYTATISITDSAGTTVSRTINFDTFTESNFTFEAEDYNFGEGQYIANPVLSTTPATDVYYGQSIAAVTDVDISTNPPATGYGIAYQRPDEVGTEVASDYLRQAYVTAQVGDPLVRDYDVGWDQSGTWFNYTRDIPAGNYLVYARLAGPGLFNGQMDLVTGATSSSQTTSPLGTFSSSGGGWQSWIWVPLLNTNGPAIVSGGNKTLRYTTFSNNNQNYFMLVPAKNLISLSISMSGGNPVISIPTQSGASYTIQYKPSLTSGTWTYLTIVQGDGTTKTVTDTTTSGSQRVYRAIIQ